MSDDSIVGSIIAAGLAALAWMGRMLYTAPRQSEVDRITKECDTLRNERDALRAVLDGAGTRAQTQLAERDAELRVLADKLARLEASVAIRSGDPDV